MARPAWERLADALLQREATICRLGEGVPPRDLAGWFVAPEDVDRILRTLPGLDGPAPELAAPLREQLDAHVADAREEFAASLTEESVMPDLARRARLSEPEAEAFALLAAVELHPQRQRLVCYIQDSVQLPRLTLATLDRMLGPAAGGALLVAPDRALRRGRLIDVEEQGPGRPGCAPCRPGWPGTCGGTRLPIGICRPGPSCVGGLHGAYPDPELCC